MVDSKNAEHIVCANHIGMGFKTIETVEAMVEALVARGAEIMPRTDPLKHKYFLRLNPDDVLELEIFHDTDGISAHVDYTVTDLVGVQEKHGSAVYDYGIPNMLFIDIPDMPNVYPLQVQLGFAVRPSENP